VFAATPEQISVRSFEADAYSGVVEGRLTMSPNDLSAPATADLRWRDIDLSLLPIEMPQAAAGLVSFVKVARSFRSPFACNPPIASLLMISAT